MLLATLVFCVEITLENKLANVTGNFSVLCRNNTGNKLANVTGNFSVLCRNNTGQQIGKCYWQL